MVSKPIIIKPLVYHVRSALHYQMLEAMRRKREELRELAKKHNTVKEKELD